MAHPRYGLSIPNRGVLYGVTTVEQILDLAAQWASLDQVAGGRTILGACVGGSPPRSQAERGFAPFGVKLSERGPRAEPSNSRTLSGEGRTADG